MAEENKVPEVAPEGATPDGEAEGQVQQQEPEKIKIGDREFTPEELDKRLKYSDIAIGSEEKYNRPISKFWPEFTKNKQELEEMRKAQQEQATKKEQEEKERFAKTPAEELSPDQIRERAREELRGLGAVTKEEFDTEVRRVVNDIRFVDKIESILADAKEDGKPSVSAEEFLKFMLDRKIGNPEDAYLIMFKDDLNKIEQEKLKSLKKEGLKTQEGSTAGSKKPPQQTPPTKDNLQDRIKSHLEATRG